jgi:MoaA/NifB/PqqE/SkfB family radical SAM enzyme
LEGCRSVAAAARLLQRSKAELYAGLYAARFSPFAAQALTVKILNLFLARYHLRARSSTVLSRPFGLVIDPSNVCRLACPGCVHSDRNQALEIFDWPNGTLPESRIAALLELYGPYAIGAYFCNYGEPLLNLQTPRFIRLAKTYLMSTALSTSLSVQRFDAEAYVRSGLDFMVISIDGATQPVYQRFRRNGDLELVFGNIRKLVEAKRRLRRRTPVLSWNFLAFEHNVHEIPAAVQKARKLGVNQFRVVNPFDVTWDDPSIRPAAVEGGVRRLDTFSTASDPENWNPFPEEAPKAAVTSAFEKLWSDPPAVNDRPSSGHTCHWLYKNIVMDAGGRIMPCCGGPPRDGSLVFDTLEGAGRDVFNSEKYRQARLWFSTGYVSENAPYCTRCEWDHATVNIGSQEILRYFRSADPAFFDRRSLRLLSEC